MKNKEVNAVEVWKQLEDVLVPRLGLSVVDRAVYSHLVRHSRLEGLRRVRFSIARLARGAGLSLGPVREAVRRLADHGALRLVERSKQGHVAEVRLPEEIRAACPERIGEGSRVRPAGAGRFEATVWGRRSRPLREAIHLRDGGRCFYCLQRLTPVVRCLDHVVPRARRGRDTYGNLVSCCLECNSRKGQTPAEGFLRELYRERRLTGAELTARLHALDALASGKFQPVVAKAVHRPLRSGGSRGIGGRLIGKSGRRRSG